jgi:hypothetical protein
MAIHGRRCGAALLLAGAMGGVAAAQVRHLERLGATIDGRHGAGLATVGDVDGDGADDLLVAAPESPGPLGILTGRVELLSGRTGALIRSHTGANRRDLFGASICAGGDFDGDGIGDYAIGAPKFLVSPLIGRAGRAELFSGADGRVLATWDGTWYCQGVGAKLVMLEDFDGDGRRDLLGLCEPDVWVLSGAGGRLIELELDDEQATAAALIDDVDGDGRREIAIGSSWHSGLIDREGRVRVFSGADGRFLADFHGERSDDAIGRDLVPAGDVDGDGVREIWVSGRNWTAFIGSALDGMVELRHGRTFDVMTRIDGVAKQRLGDRLACGSDWNGDEVPELLTTLPGVAPQGAVQLRDGRDGALLHEWLGVEADAGFGAALATGDWNGDRIGDAGIGIPSRIDADGDVIGAVQLLLGCPASRAPYGADNGGELGAPTLALDRAPALGAAVKLAIDAQATADRMGVLVLGDRPQDVAFGRGARLLVTPQSVEWITVPAEGLEIADTLPDDPALAFSRWYAQVLLLDAAATGGISATRGLEMVIGFDL